MPTQKRLADGRLISVARGMRHWTPQTIFTTEFIVRALKYGVNGLVARRPSAYRRGDLKKGRAVCALLARSEATALLRLLRKLRRAGRPTKRFSKRKRSSLLAATQLNCVAKLVFTRASARFVASQGRRDSPPHAALRPLASRAKTIAS